MALQKTLVAIDFTKGIDKKTDEKLVIPGALTRLENAHFSDKGTLTKRRGSAALTAGVVGGGTLTDAAALRAVRNELLRVSSDSLYSYTAAGWSLRGAAKDATFAVARRTMFRAPAGLDVSASEHCVNGTVGACAWLENSTADAYVATYDTASGARLSAETKLGAGTCYAVRCVPVGASILVFWTELVGAAVELRCRIIATATPASIGIVIVLRADVDGIYFHAVPGGTGAVVAYPTTGGFTLLNVSEAGGGSGATAVASGATSYIALGCSATAVVVAYAYTTGMAARIFDLAFVQTSSLILDAAVAGRRISVANISVTAWTVVWTWYSGSTARRIYRSVFLENGSLVSSAGELLRGLETAGDIGVIAGRGYLLARFTDSANTGGSASMTQGYAAVVDASTGEIVGRLLRDSTPSTLVGDYSPRAVVSGSALDWTIQEKGRLEFQSSVERSTRGLTRAGVEIVPAGRAQSADIGGVLHFAGARPMAYDGMRILEAGFDSYPENITGAAGGAGNLAAGVYQAVVVWEFTDAQGNFERSAMSPPLSWTAAAGSSHVLTIPTLRTTRKESATGGAAVVHVFRTEVNGTVFYRESSVTSPISNTTAADSVTFTATASDASLIANEALNTSALDSAPWPECKAIHVHQDRLFVARAEDPTAFAFSTKKTDGNAPIFNEVLAGRIPPTHGDLVCFATLDDRLILFAERGIYALTGEGPDANGLGGGYSEPQDLIAGVGCADWRSVVTTPAGVFFWDGSRFNLLDRGLQVSPIGEAVEAWTKEADGYTIASAVYVAELKQVRFQVLTNGLDTRSSGFALVYDLRIGQWSRFPSYGAIDACIHGGLYVRATTAGKVLQESRTLFTDDGAIYLMALETGWLKLAGVLGFQRAYRALALGQCESDFTVHWDIGYDFLDYDVVNDRDRILSTSYTVGGPVHARRHLRVQKCHALRLRFEEVTSAAPYSCLSLTGFALEIGAKRGHFKNAPNVTPGPNPPPPGGGA